MKKMFIFLFCLLLSATNLFADNFTVSENGEILSSNQSSYTIKRINDFEIEISGFKNERKFILVNWKSENKNLKQLSIIVKDTPLEQDGFFPSGIDRGYEYSGKQKTSTIKIVAENQILFSELDIYSVFGTPYLKFYNLNFGKSKEQIEAEEQEELRRIHQMEEYTKKRENAPAMDNFWGIKFGKTQSEVIQDMKNKGCIKYNIIESGSYAVNISFYEINDYATTHPVRIDLEFYNDKFYKATVVYEEFERRSKDAVELFQIVKEKYCLDYEDNYWDNYVKGNYRLSEKTESKKVSTNSSTFGKVSAIVYTTEIIFEDYDIKSEKINFENKEVQANEENRRKSMYDSL